MSHCANLLTAFRKYPNRFFTNSEVHDLAGFRYSSRLCQLRKKGIEIESSKSEHNEGLWYYRLVKDNPAIIIDKNGEMKDTSLSIQKEVKQVVKEGFWNSLWSEWFE